MDSVPPTPRKFRTVSKDEFESLVAAQKKDLEAALERGRQARLAAERAAKPPVVRSTLRFSG